ncbi:MAG: fasciclin domain-containing protein [Thermoplasmata archaeon]
MENIVEVAVKSGKFPTLVKAVQVAGLVDALSLPGPFTVFAPAEEAFKSLPKGTLEGLLADKEKLGSVLKYHVLSGKYTSADVLSGLKKSNNLNLLTLQGEQLRITSAGLIKKHIRINQANLVSIDIQASNGVIHVIDKVVIPSRV